MAKKGKKPPVKKNTNKMRTRWLNNAMKSVGLAARAEIKKVAPTTYSIQSNMTETVRNTVKTMRKPGNASLAKQMKNNKYVKLADKTIKTAIRDLKAGNLYNPDHMAEAFEESMQDEDDGYGYSDDTGFDDWDDWDEEDNVTVNYVDNGGNADTGRQITRGAATLAASIQSGTQATLTAQQAAIDAMVGVSSNLLYSVDRGFDEMGSHLSNMDATLTSILEFHQESTANFYESAMATFEKLGERFATDEDEDYDTDSRKDEDYSRLFGSKSIDASKFKEVLKNNIKEAVDSSSAGQLKGILNDQTLSMMVADPVGYLTQGIFAMVIPRALEQSLNVMDKALTEFIPNMMVKFGRWQDEGGRGIKNNLKRYVGKIFGIKSEVMDNLSEHEVGKENATFDKRARNAIVEVLPKYARESTAYLREIAMHVTKKDDETLLKGQQIFNHQTGFYSTPEEMKKTLKESMEDTFMSAFSDSEFGKVLNNIGNSGHFNASRTKQFNKLLPMFYAQLASAGNMMAGDFNVDDKDSMINQVLGQLPETLVVDGKKEHYKDGIKILRESIRQMNAGNVGIGSVTSAQLKAFTQWNDLITELNKDPEAYGTLAMGLNSETSMHELMDKLMGNTKSLENRKAAKAAEKKAEEDAQKEEDKELNLANRGRKRKNIKNAVAAGITEHIEEQNTTLNNDFRSGNLVNAMVSENAKEMIKSAGVGFKNATYSIMKGDTMATLQNFGEIVKNTAKDVWKTTKLALFGDGEDGEKKGLFDGVKEAINDTYNSIMLRINGKPYTDSKGVEHKLDDDEKPLATTLTEGFKEIKEGIKYKLFGGTDEEGNESEGIINKIGTSISTGLIGWKQALFGKGAGEKDVEEMTADDLKEERTKIKDAMIKATPKTLLGAGGGMIVNALAGSSILGTMIGGPIGGAVIGIGTSLLSSSNKFKDWLFGPEIEDPDGTKQRLGGFISASTQNFFKKHKKAIIGGAGLGLVKGLIFPAEGKLGFMTQLLGGPIGGAALGIGFSLLKDSKMFKEFLYGNEEKGKRGIITAITGTFKRKNGTGSKDDKESKGLLKTLGMGAIGVGGGIAAAKILSNVGLMGWMATPAGPIGGAILGLSVGLAASGKKFAKLLFGEKNEETGKREGGMLTKVMNFLSVEVLHPVKSKLMDWGEDLIYTVNYEVLENIRRPFVLLANKFKESFKSVSESIIEPLQKFGYATLKHLFTPLATIATNVFSPVRTAVGKIADFAYGVTKRTLTLPFKIVGKVTSFITSGVGKLLGAVGGAIFGVIKGIGGFVFRKIKKIFRKVGGGILTVAGAIRNFIADRRSKSKQEGGFLYKASKNLSYIKAVGSALFGNVFGTDFALADAERKEAKRKVAKDKQRRKDLDHNRALMAKYLGYNASEFTEENMQRAINEAKRQKKHIHFRGGDDREYDVDTGKVKKAAEELLAKGDSVAAIEMLKHADDKSIRQLGYTMDINHQLAQIQEILGCTREEAQEYYDSQDNIDQKKKEAARAGLKTDDHGNTIDDRDALDDDSAFKDKVAKRAAEIAAAGGLAGYTKQKISDKWKHSYLNPYREERPTPENSVDLMRALQDEGEEDPTILERLHNRRENRRIRKARKQAARERRRNQNQEPSENPFIGFGIDDTDDIIESLDENQRRGIFKWFRKNNRTRAKGGPGKKGEALLVGDGGKNDKDKSAAEVWVPKEDGRVIAQGPQGLRVIINGISTDVKKSLGATFSASTKEGTKKGIEESKENITESALDIMQQANESSDKTPKQSALDIMQQGQVSNAHSDDTTADDRVGSYASQQDRKQAASFLNGVNEYRKNVLETLRDLKTGNEEHQSLFGKLWGKKGIIKIALLGGIAWLIGKLTGITGSDILGGLTKLNDYLSNIMENGISINTILGGDGNSEEFSETKSEMANDELTKLKKIGKDLLFFNPFGAIYHTITDENGNLTTRSRNDARIIAGTVSKGVNKKSAKGLFHRTRNLFRHASNVFNKEIEVVTDTAKKGASKAKSAVTKYTEKKAAKKAAQEAGEATIESATKTTAKEVAEEGIKKSGNSAAKKVTQEAGEAAVESGTKAAVKEAGETAAKKTTESVVKESVETASKGMTKSKFVKEVSDGFKLLVSKLSKNKKIDQKAITAIEKEAIPEVTDQLTKHYPKIANKLNEKMSTAATKQGITYGGGAVSGGLITAGIVALCAVDGLSAASEIFEVTEPDWRMHAITTAWGAIDGLCILPAIIEIAADLIEPYAGVNFFKWTCWRIYEAIVGTDSEEATLMKESQSEMTNMWNDVKNTQLKRQYKTLYNSGKISEDTTFEQYKKDVGSGKQKATFTDKRDYVSRQWGRASSSLMYGLGDAWTVAKNVFTGKKKYYDPVEGIYYTKYTSDDIKTILKGVDSGSDVTVESSVPVDGYLMAYDKYNKYPVGGDGAGFIAADEVSDEVKNRWEESKNGLFTRTGDYAKNIFNNIVKGQDDEEEKAKRRYNIDNGKMTKSEKEESKAFHKSLQKASDLLKSTTNTKDTAKKNSEDATIKATTSLNKGYEQASKILGLDSDDKTKTKVSKTTTSKVYYTIDYRGYYKKSTDGRYYYYNMNGDLVDGKDISNEDFMNLIMHSMVFEGTEKEVQKAKKDRQKSAIEVIDELTGTSKKSANTQKSNLNSITDFLTKNNIDIKTTKSTVRVTNNSSKKTVTGGKGEDSNAGFTYFSQEDARWKNKSYDSAIANDGGTIGDSGCGPTVMAMVIDSMKGKTYTPDQLSNLAVQGGFRDASGTNNGFIDYAGQQAGLSTTKTQNVDLETLQSASKENPVVLNGASTNDGPFTESGHYIVAVGHDDLGNVIVNDPRGKEFSKAYAPSELMKNTSTAWKFKNGGSGRGKERRRLGRNLFRGGRGRTYQNGDGGINGVPDYILNNSGSSSNTSDSTVNYTGRTYQNGDGGINGVPDTVLNQSGGHATGSSAGSGWLGTVQKVKTACSEQVGKYTYGGSSVPVTVDGKQWTMPRPDCSGFVSLCLQVYGAIPEGQSYNSTAFASANINGFTNQDFPGWENCKAGDILVLPGSHVEIFAETKNGVHYVYNWGGQSSAGNPGATPTGHKSGYSKILRPASAGAASFEGTSIATTSNTNTNGSFLSKALNVFTKFSSKAIEGVLTGNWDYNFDDDTTTTTSTNTTTSSSGDYGTSADLSNATLDQMETAKTGYSFYKNQGYSDEAIAGLFGNFQQESQMNARSIQKNGAGPAAGIAQWENYNTKSKRWKEMNDYAESKGRQWTDPISQFEFVDKELSGNCDDTWTATLLNRRGGISTFKQLTDVHKAVSDFEETFERAGDAQMENRYNYADTWYQRIKNGELSGGSGYGSRKRSNLTSRPRRTKANTSTSRGGRGAELQKYHFIDDENEGGYGIEKSDTRKPTRIVDKFEKRANLKKLSDTTKLTRDVDNMIDSDLKGLERHVDGGRGVDINPNLDHSTTSMNVTNTTTTPILEQFDSTTIENLLKNMITLLESINTNTKETTGSTSVIKGGDNYVVNNSNDNRVSTTTTSGGVSESRNSKLARKIAKGL